MHEYNPSLHLSASTYNGNTILVTTISIINTMSRHIQRMCKHTVFPGVDAVVTNFSPSAETSGDYSRAAKKTFIVVKLHTRIMKRFVLSSIPSCFSPSAFIRSFTSLLMALSRIVAPLASTWTPFKGVVSGL